MANVVRLVNGGTIQVRTGVLQGVGPEGPTGPTGPEGPPGPQGPVGEVGPMGQILQIQTRVNISSTTTMNPSAQTLIAFGTVQYDDLSAATSSTNYTLADTGDYLLSAWIRWSAPAGTPAGDRHVILSSSITGTIARTTALGRNTDSHMTLTYPYRSTTNNDVITVQGLSTDGAAVGISQGAFTITRIGSGPRGLTGPAGSTGPTGPTGPQGIQGPAGSSSSGFATYTQLKTP